MEEKVVVLITGKKRAGKSTLASKLTLAFSDLGLDVAKLSYANFLKKIMRELGVDKYHITKRKYKNFEDFYKTLKEVLIRRLYAYKDLLEKVLEREKESLKEIYEEYFEKKNKNYGYRKLAQILGTEILRSVKEEIHVEKLLEKLTNIIHFVDVVIIDDYRFPNEDLKEILKDEENVKVVRIKVEANDLEEDELSNHASEREVDKLKVDMVVKRKAYSEEFYIDIKELVKKIIEGGEKWKV